MVKEIYNLGSSSKGNAYFLVIERQPDYWVINDGSTNTFGLLLECGLPFDVMSRRLREQSKGKYSMVDVGAVLVSHRHGDHAHSVKEMLDMGKKVFAPIEVFTHHGIDINKTMYKDYATPLDVGVRKSIVSKIAVTPFELEHDERKNMRMASKELMLKDLDYEENAFITNYGYIITINGDYNVLFFTDTMFIPYDLNTTGLKFNMIIGEANYFTTPIHFAYQNAKEQKNYGNIKRYERLLYSHMSVETFVKTLNGLDLSKCERIFAVHTSSSERVVGDEIRFLQYIKNNLKPQRNKNLKILVCKENGSYATGGI